MQEQTYTGQRILESALHLFSTRGYVGATTREIAKNAGIAEVTLFRHFESKEKLFESVLNTYSFLPALKGLLPQVADKPYEEAMLTIATRFYEKLTHRKEMIKLIQAEVQRYPEKLLSIHKTFVDELRQTLAGYFKDLQKKKILADFDPEIGAMAFLGMCFSYFNSQEILMHKKHTQKTKEETLSGFVKIFVRGTAV